MLKRDVVGCKQSLISGTGWSAGLSLGSPLLVHISNSFCVCWETLTAIPLPAPCLTQSFPPFASHHVTLLLSTVASHSPFVLPESRAGSAVYSLTGWPVQLLGENQIALICPRAEWKHSFCPLCSFSFS